MITYDLYNPTRTPRILYDGIEGSQRQLRLDPGGRLVNVALAPSVVDMLRSRRNEVEVYVRGSSAPMAPEPPPQKSTIRKSPVIIDGMWGIGDNLHQRAAIRELMKTREVWLETCHFLLYHDLVAQGLHLIFKSTRLRAQARTIEREKPLFPKSEPPPVNAPRIKIWYKKPQIDKHGSILASLMAECGVTSARPDFSLPIPSGWRHRALEQIGKWNTGGKPIMIYRPIVLRKEWDGSSRNPDPEVYAALFKSIRDKFFVVSIADLAPNLEWIVGEEQDADIKIHDGSVPFDALAALFKEANLVFCNAGFAPVLAQAVGAPSIVVYGGRESFKTTQSAGLHLAATLGIDPDHPCDCHEHRHACNKTITLLPALDRVTAFASRYSVIKPKILIFATTYVDSDARVKLTDQWLELITAKNPDCDVLLVDSASPRRPFIDEARHGKFERYDGHRGSRMLHDFGDNVGHLSRKGRDGWGRAFSFGLQAAIDCGYDYVAHIEGDSLFRKSVRDFCQDVEVASIPVRGMKQDFPTWVETGLMLFSTKYLAETKFIERYDWRNRQERPTPEIVVKNLVQDRLKMLPVNGLRGDKAQITHKNILDLDLDWVTHCHNDVWVYDKFTDAAMGREVVLPATGRSDVTAISNAATLPQPSLKLNLGCGTNVLQGWENHDVDVDISKRLPYPDNHAAFIFCEHCVEHIPYAAAVDFFKECHRVLKPGGTVRITVPSIEQVRKGSTPAYWKFSTRFQPENSLRGAMHGIMFKHGHQTCWTAALLEATLFYAGFDILTHCEVHKSSHPELTDIEGHHKVIGEDFNRIESLSYEATKQGPSLDRVAVVLGGGREVWAEAEEAKALVGDRADYFITNDMIAKFPGEATAITLHPSKLKDWLKERRGPPVKAVWAHRPFDGVTDHTEDWSGSSGLFAVKVARQKYYEKILLCGVPMDPEAGHFVRQEKWAACSAFRKAWERRRVEIAPYVRSFSGWTREMLGAPTAEFVG